MELERADLQAQLKQAVAEAHKEMARFKEQAALAVSAAEGEARALAARSQEMVDAAARAQQRAAEEMAEAA